jgi:hypothetical protein
MIRLANWEVMECALGYISTFPALPPSPHVVFISEQWLSGNLSSLCPYINILGNANSRNNSSNNSSSSSSGVLESNQEGTKDSKKHSDRSGVIVSDKNLESYLVLINTFYCNFSVPGLIEGKKGILWSKQARPCTDVASFDSAYLIEKNMTKPE